MGFDPEFRIDVTSFSAIRAKNAVNLIALTNPGTGQTPTQFQLGHLPGLGAAEHPPAAGRGEPAEVPPATGKRADRRSPAIPVGARERLVTYVARDLEPYRGFHVVMRSLPAVLRSHKDARVIMVGGDDVSYGSRLAGRTWREHMLAEVGRTLDTSRVHFPGKIDYESYLAAAAVGRACLPDLSVRRLLVAARGDGLRLRGGGSDTAPVREFVAGGTTGVLTPFFDPGALADRIGDLLEGGPAIRTMRANARRWAEKNLDMDDYLHRYETLIASLTGQKAPRRRGVRRLAAG